MATVGVDGYNLQADSADVGWMVLRIDIHLALSLHSLKRTGPIFAMMTTSLCMVLLLLSTHADRQGVDIMCTVCLFFVVILCLYGYGFIRQGYG